MKYITFFSDKELPYPISEKDLRTLIPLAKSDVKIRNYIVEKNMRLAIYYVSRRYHSTNIDINDLVSIAMTSLVMAVDNFDINRGNSFASYATAAIEHNISKYLMKENKTILGQLEPSSSQMEIISNPEDNILREERSDIITLLVDSLPNDIREVIKLKFGFYDRVYSNIEISKIMNISTNTVVSRANKGLKIIKDILIKSNIYEENSGLKPVTLENTLYDYFKGVPRERVREALTVLTPLELSTLDKVFTMKEINYRPRRKVINKDVLTTEKNIVPKIKAILKKR